MRVKVLRSMIAIVATSIVFLGCGSSGNSSGSKSETSTTQALIDRPGCQVRTSAEEDAAALAKVNEIQKAAAAKSAAALRASLEAFSAGKQMTNNGIIHSLRDEAVDFAAYFCWPIRVQSLVNQEIESLNSMAREVEALGPSGYLSEADLLTFGEAEYTAINALKEALTP